MTGSIIIIIPLLENGYRKKYIKYGGSSLLSHGLKIYKSILHGRIRKYVEPIFEEKQHGFRQRRSNVDVIYATRMLQVP